MMTRYGKAVWLGLFLLIAVYFGFFEWKALSEPDGLTLSRFILRRCISSITGGSDSIGARLLVDWPQWSQVS